MTCDHREAEISSLMIAADPHFTLSRETTSRLRRDGYRAITPPDVYISPEMGVGYWVKQRGPALYLFTGVT